MPIAPIDSFGMLSNCEVQWFSAVGRLPQSAGRETDVDDHRIFFRARDFVDASHHCRRTDRAELEPAQQRIGGLIGGRDFRHGFRGALLRPQETGGGQTASRNRR